MSTRSVTIIRQTTYCREGAKTEEIMRFYRHCDGYPEGHGLEMAEAIRNADYDKTEGSYWVAGLLKWFLTNNPFATNVNFEDGNSQHGDLEYLYVVDGLVDFRWGGRAWREAANRHQSLRNRLGRGLCRRGEARADIQRNRIRVHQEVRGEVMKGVEYKLTVPRRQAMLSIREPHHKGNGIVEYDEVALVPVFVWPMPTTEGLFVVEHQDGTAQRVQPDSLTFLGSKELFDQYDWSES